MQFCGISCRLPMAGAQEGEFELMSSEDDQRR